MKKPASAKTHLKSPKKKSKAPKAPAPLPQAKPGSSVPDPRYAGSPQCGVTEMASR